MGVTNLVRLTKNITGYQRDLMKMRADHAASLHCDIFTIITNKHSSHKILSETQLWSGPMRALVTQAMCLHISSYECSHWSRMIGFGNREVA